MNKMMMKSLIVTFALAVSTSQTFAQTNWTVLTDDSFESNYGSWVDGGSDCTRNTLYPSDGSYAIQLRDNSGNRSSTWLEEGLDLSNYSELRISFSYYATSFERGEEFLLQFSSDGGSSYTDIRAWEESGDPDIIEGSVVSESIIVSAASYDFSSNCKIKFECDASANSDLVYIDSVVIEASGSAPAPLIKRTLTSDGFEGGYGNWVDGGGDCSRNSSFPSGGEYAIRLRDNSGDSSSTWLDENLDLSEFSELKVSFNYYATSFESGESFSLLYSSDGGSSYETVQTWEEGGDPDIRENSVRSESIILSASSYDFSSSCNFKFECDASNNSDEVYIDNISIEASGENAPSPASVPSRTILLIVDGLAKGTLDNISMPNVASLKDEGVWYESVHLPMPAHYSENYDTSSPEYYPWGSSLPNPVQMSGSPFIGISDLKTSMLQNMFDTQVTAFLTNDDHYDDISIGYDLYHMYGEEDWVKFADDLVIDDAINVIEQENPVFLRLHCQGPGASGWDDEGSIWDSDSLYRAKIEEMDFLIGDLVAWLKSTGRWEDTVLFITSDHGQDDDGGHTAYKPKGNQMEMLIVGKNIKQGMVFDYAETTDIVATISSIHQVPSTPYGQGRILTESFVGNPDTYETERYIERLNSAMLEYHDEGYSNPDFLIIEEIGSWHNNIEPATMQNLVEHQEAILESLR